MDINRRDFLQIAAALGLLGAAGGTNLFAGEAGKERIKNLSFSDIVEFESKGTATLLHICDMHAHIKPLYWREPSTLISAKNLVGTPGFICGDSFESYYGIEPGSLDQYFDTYNNFPELAKKFGKMGGIAHMKPIISKRREVRKMYFFLTVVILGRERQSHSKQTVRRSWRHRTTLVSM